LTNEGQHIEYNNQNVPVFMTSNSFGTFVFTPSIVYAARYDKGIYKFENETWSIVKAQYSPKNLSVDGDTIWTSSGVDAEYHKISPVLIETIPGNRFDRSVHRKGNFWGSTSFDYGIFKMNLEGPSFLVNPDTCSLLNSTNYDFKFSKKTDSLYVAGSQGLSIAFGNTFIDSIDIFSSIDMPNSGILEFEFDNKDNIWALFGEIAPNPNFTIPHSLAYYTQSTRTWSKFYDSNNSPIDFSNEFTIEVDTAGNLWVAQGLFLHVLKINEVPSWLNTQKLTSKLNIGIYPNPVTDILTIQNNEYKIQKISIYDLSGKLILEQKEISIGDNKIDLNAIQKGYYLIKIEAENGVLTSKFQKN
jgi:hypothetical protein